MYISENNIQNPCAFHAASMLVLQSLTFTSINLVLGNKKKVKDRTTEAKTTLFIANKWI